MADTEKSLDILIRTKAELAGAKQVEEALERDIGKAKALGNTEQLQKANNDLDRVREAIKKATEANAELADGEKQGGEASEFLHQNHQKIHKLLHEMGRETIPVVGQGMVSMMAGPLAPAFALLAVVGGLREMFSSWSEELDRAGEDAAKSSFLAGIEAMKKALEEGESKMRSYTATVGELAKHEVTIAQALSSQLMLMRAVFAEREKEAKAAEELEKARRERKEKAGDITPEQAVIQDTTAQINAAKREHDSRQAEQDAEINRQQNALDNASLKQRDLNREAQEKSEKYFAQKGRRERLQQDFGNDEEYNRLKEKGQKVVEEQEEKLRKMREDQRAAKMTGQPSWSDQQVSDQEQEVKRLQGALNLLYRGRRQYERAFSPAGNTAFETAKRDMDNADQAGRDNAKFMDDTTRKLNDSRAERDRTRPIQDQELADRIATILERAVTKLYSQPRGAELETGIKIADRVQGGGNINAAESQFLMALDAALGGHANNVKDAAAHVEKYKNNTEAFFQSVIALTTNGFTAQQKQIDQLFTIVSRIQSNSNVP